MLYFLISPQIYNLKQTDKIFFLNTNTIGDIKFKYRSFAYYVIIANISSFFVERVI